MKSTMITKYDGIKGYIGKDIFWVGLANPKEAYLYHDDGRLYRIINIKGNRGKVVEIKDKKERVKLKRQMNEYGRQTLATALEKSMTGEIQSKVNNAVKRMISDGTVEKIILDELRRNDLI